MNTFVAISHCSSVHVTLMVFLSQLPIVKNSIKHQIDTQLPPASLLKLLIIKSDNKTEIEESPDTDPALSTADYQDKITCWLTDCWLVAWIVSSQGSSRAGCEAVVVVVAPTPHPCRLGPVIDSSGVLPCSTEMWAVSWASPFLSDHPTSTAVTGNIDLSSPSDSELLLLLWNFSRPASRVSNQ